MLPRYLPSIGWRSWRDWLLAREGNTNGSWQRFQEVLGVPGLPQFHYVFDSLRTGLAAYFSNLKRRSGGGNIVLSSQICRAVPRAIEHAGLAVKYVDVDRAYPTPAAEQFVAALDQRTVGVLIAPIYGHIQPEWAPLVAALDRRALVLDLAQGIGLATRVADLARHADVAAYSFGLGKGLDTGGGLLLSRAQIELPAWPTCRKTAIATSLIKAVALRVMVSAGFYRAVVSRLDSLDDSETSLPGRSAFAPDDIHRLWQARLSVFLGEIELARQRAQALAGMPSLTARLRDPAVYFDTGASHLRQVIRLNDAARRDGLILRLRASGVDCAPAGEPLPDIANASARFPNAAGFRSAAVRLPFLGRISAAQFDRFRMTLEKTVVQHLS